MWNQQLLWKILRIPQQVNTLGVTKEIYFIKFYRNLGSWTHLSIFSLSVSVFCCPQSPSVKTQGGKATGTVWLHPGYPVAIGRSISKSYQRGWGWPYKDTSGPGCVLHISVELSGITTARLWVLYIMVDAVGAGLNITEAIKRRHNQVCGRCGHWSFSQITKEVCYC